jgi:hypothetical protein
MRRDTPNIKSTTATKACFNDAERKSKPRPHLFIASLI